MGTQREFDLELIVNVIKEQSGETNVTPTTDVVDDLGFDSLDCVELVMKIEEAFDIEIPDEDWHTGHTAGTVKLRTPTDFADYVEKQMRATHA